MDQEQQRIEGLFREHRQGLERYLRSRLYVPDEAKEVVQESYARLMELPKGREVPNWPALLWRTACNIAINRNKHRQHQQRARPLLEVDHEDDQTPESALAAKQLEAAAQRAIAELPERQRQVVTLHAEGHNYEQIAQQLDISERTCRRDHEQALVEIRQKIGMEQPT